MKASELNIILRSHGRIPLGRLVNVPLKDTTKTLFADMFHGKAYSYFLVDANNVIKEGHIYVNEGKKMFGVYDIPEIQG